MYRKLNIVLGFWYGQSGHPVRVVAHVHVLFILLHLAMSAQKNSSVFWSPDSRGTTHMILVTWPRTPINPASRHLTGEDPLVTWQQRHIQYSYLSLVTWPQGSRLASSLVTWQQRSPITNNSILVIWHRIITLTLWQPDMTPEYKHAPTTLDLCHELVPWPMNYCIYIILIRDDV